MAIGAVEPWDGAVHGTPPSGALQALPGPGAPAGIDDRLAWITEELLGCAAELQASSPGTNAAAGHLLAVERVGRLAGYVQVLAAQAADRANIAGIGLPVGTKAGRPEYRNTADYMRSALRISLSEAHRRLAAGALLLPGRSLSGAPLAPVYPLLGEAVAAGELAVDTALIAAGTIKKVAPAARQLPSGGQAELQRMEQQLAATAAQADPQIVRRVAERWEAYLDQDGVEPTEQVKKELQGLFHKGKRFGLNQILINADDEQFEILKTAYSPEAAPRTGAKSHPEDRAHAETADGEEAEVAPDPRTAAQKLLDGLVNAARAALGANKLPTAGGQRPQVIVTIDYQTLLGQVADASTRTSESVFQGPFNPSTIRRMACNADIIPVVLGGEGEVLDLGRSRRLFTTEQRKALIARDRGCTFPGCTMPATWTEAHHVDPWSQGGTTDVGSGALCCPFHHHLVHDGEWSIVMSTGVPYWVPPPHLDPSRRPLRNSFHHADFQEELVL